MEISVPHAETIAIITIVLLGGTSFLALISALADWEMVFFWTSRGLFAAGFLGGVLISVGIFGPMTLVIWAMIAGTLLSLSKKWLLLWFLSILAAAAFVLLLVVLGVNKILPPWLWHDTLWALGFGALVMFVTAGILSSKGGENARGTS